MRNTCARAKPTWMPDSAIVKIGDNHPLNCIDGAGSVIMCTLPIEGVASDLCLQLDPASVCADTF